MRKGFRVAAPGERNDKITDFVRIERIQNGYLLRYLWCSVSEPKELEAHGYIEGPGVPRVAFVRVKDTILFCADDDALLEGVKKAMKANEKVRESKKRKDAILSLDYDWE